MQSTSLHDESKKPFVFISYSHRDTKLVLPVIRRMMQDNYRVWYDDGIDPGTEWDTMIATQIKDCSYLIAFISENYLTSENCKDELNYARDKSKQRLLVYLNDVELPDGMRMRLSRLQAIYKYAYVQEEDFYAKLYSTSGLEQCRRKPAETANEKVAESAQEEKLGPVNTVDPQPVVQTVKQEEPQKAEGQEPKQQFPSELSPVKSAVPKLPPLARDWICFCGCRNAINRLFCAACGADRPAKAYTESSTFSVSQATTAKAQDWICTCGGRNSAQSRYCYICSIEKPGTVGTTKNRYTSDSKSWNKK